MATPATNTTAQSMDTLCKGLVSVNPDITGVGVVIAFLAQSIYVGVFVTLPLSVLDTGLWTGLRHVDAARRLLRKTLRQGLEQQLLLGLAQLITATITFRKLSYDQLYEIASLQLMIVLQTGAGVFYVSSDLSRMGGTLFSAVVAAYVALLLHLGIQTSRVPPGRLDKICLSQFWGRGAGRYASLGTQRWRLPADYPVYLFWFAAAYFVLTGTGALSLRFCWRRVHAAAVRRRGGSELGAKVRWWVRRVRGIAYFAFALSSVVGSFVGVGYTIETYRASRAMKADRSDMELTFGQISALFMVAATLWGAGKGVKKYHNIGGEEVEVGAVGPEGERVEGEVEKPVVRAEPVRVGTEMSMV
ncbi:hypothetical protein EDC01DRAFT_485706 [Geopyxis carbonaria]|nr:hypothetical protein EDC01DRAFT_485706 [Geopyxis carbonaria]